MVAYLFLCLRRQAGLSAVSSLTAAGLSILRPVLLRLAENPPALPGRVWGGLRGAGGHGEPAWPGLCRTPVSPVASSRTQNVIAQPLLADSALGVRSSWRMLHHGPSALPALSWFPRALCSCRAATPCGPASRSPARTPAPLASGPCQPGTAVCSLIWFLSSPVCAALGWPLAMTGVAVSPAEGQDLRSAGPPSCLLHGPCAPGGGRPELSSQPSSVLVGAVVWAGHAAPGLSEPPALPPGGHAAPATVAPQHGVCSVASPRLCGWPVRGVGPQAL